MSRPTERIKRVCLVIENHPAEVMGGAQFQAHLLAQCFAERDGIEVLYLARRAAVDPDPEQWGAYDVLKIGSDKGIRRRAVFFDLPGLQRALAEFKPDLIYQRMRQSYTALCARYAHRHRIPFFFHVASEMDLRPAVLPEHLFSLSTPFRAIENALGIWGMRRASNRLVQNVKQSQLLKSCFGLDADLVVPNFQPLPDTLPESSQDDGIRIFWVANFKEVKRPELLLELAQSLQSVQQIRFIVAGRVTPQSGYAALYSELARLPTVDCLGEVDPDEVARQMALADFHLSTSLIEGFPNTFIEAWANGAIVLSLSVDPVDGGMEPAGVGRVCDGDLGRAEAIIRDALADKASFEAMRHRAFAYVHGKHSMTVASELVDYMLCAPGASERRAAA